VEKDNSTTEPSLTEKELPVPQEHEKVWQQKFQALEQENEALRQELEERISPLDEVADDVLGERLRRLGDPPLDTLIREAGVVLEDRLRQLAGEAGPSLHGVGLVDAIMNFKTGSLILSKHPGEQEGVRMLYRGAMQFIRNPPMHRLIEYPESTVRIFIRLMDTLLQFLEEVKPRSPGEATVDDVRRMLSDRRIPPGELALYKALYAAGDEGLSLSDLAVAMEVTSAQLSGVLGALGRRLGRLEGFEGVGSIVTVLDWWEDSKGHWFYRMKPVLRQALEEEEIL
jgi:hypothetical protein